MQDNAKPNYLVIDVDCCNGNDNLKIYYPSRLATIVDCTSLAPRKKTGAVSFTKVFMAILVSYAGAHVASAVAGADTFVDYTSL